MVAKEKLVAKVKQKGSVIYKEDGTHYPSFKGLNLLKPSRTLIGDAKRGVSRPKEMVMGLSTVWRVVGPLVARGAANIEIAEVTDYTYEQVCAAAERNSRRVEWSRIEEARSWDFVQERRRRAFAHARKIKKQGGNISDSEKKSISFARKLIKAKLISGDLSYWDQLKNLYQGYDRELPYDFSERLRLEVFYRAQADLAGGNHKKAVLYGGLGEKVDASWFESSLIDEEEFVREALISKELSKSGYGMDEKGVYREGPEGLRLRPIDQNGGSILTRVHNLQAGKRAYNWMTHGANGNKLRAGKY